MKQSSSLQKLAAHNALRAIGQQFAFASEYRLSRVRTVEMVPTIFDDPGKVAGFWQSHVEESPWFDAEKECLVALMLDPKLKLRGFHMVSIGTFDATMFQPRDIFRPSVLCGATGIIVGHNHPSGDPRPSEADMAVTSELIWAGRILGIEVRDHVIVGGGKYVSLCESGMMREGSNHD